MNLTLVDVPSRVVPLAGGPIALCESGDAAAPITLFVPGYTGSKEDFALVARDVAAAGFRYIAYDQRGQHESPGPDDLAAYSVEALATELLELLDVLDPTGRPVHLVGHSFGGLVARAAAIAAPGRLASLVLMDSGPAALGGTRVSAMEALRPVLDNGGMGALFDALTSLRESPLPADVMTFLRRRFVSSSEAGLRGMGDALVTEPDRTEELRATGVRTLVLCGEHDDAWSPAEQREMAERLGAEYVEIPGAIHSPAAEQPVATTAALVSFWRG